VKRNNKDLTYILGKRYIDAIIAISGILQYIDRWQLIDYNEIIIIGYWGYVFNISLEEYFDSKAFQVDWTDNSKLNSKNWATRTNSLKK